MNSKGLIIMLCIGLLGGILVLAFNRDYKVEKNLLSNRDYYPSIQEATDERGSTSEQTDTGGTSETVFDFLDQDK